MMKTLTVALPAIGLALVIVASPADSSAAKLPEPASWGLELRIGTYQPQVGTDSIGYLGKDEHDYYEQMYGTDRPLMVGVEFDRYLAYPFGLLGVFAQVSHWKVSAHTRVCQEATGGACDPNDPATIFSSTAGNDKTSLIIVPMSLGAVYRFDLLKQKWDIPIAAYAKFGLDYYFWWSMGGGQISAAPGLEGKGGTAGLHGSVGLALNLNWIDKPGTEQHRVFLDSYFFVEGTQIWANSFGDDERLDMSARQLLFGISFEFE